MEVTPPLPGCVAGPQTHSFPRMAQDALKRPKLGGAGGAGLWQLRCPRGAAAAAGPQCPLTRLFPFLAAPLPAARPPEPGQAQNQPKLTQGQARVPAMPPRGHPAGQRGEKWGWDSPGKGIRGPQRSPAPWHPPPPKSSQSKIKPPRQPQVTLTRGVSAAARPLCPEAL